MLSPRPWALPEVTGGNVMMVCNLPNVPVTNGLVSLPRALCSRISEYFADPFLLSLANLLDIIANYIGFSKRVPLIAIPTEQAPRDFVEKHQDYADKIFVACIKRWPITSLHPFGTLVEQLGKMGELKVETDALLRDNNFASDEFSDAVTRSVGLDDWSLEKEDEAALAARRDFRSERTFTIDPNGANELDDAIHVKTEADGKIEIGVHIADVAHFIKANSLVDREAKKRGTAVYLMNR